MKPKLQWTPTSREELATHLDNSQLLSSQAVGDSNVYHCRTETEETLAISLPGTGGLIVRLSQEVSPAQERRRRRAKENLPATR